eukprot:scaffold323_cov181-Ochromonas_danica.AAC.8
MVSTGTKSAKSKPSGSATKTSNNGLHAFFKQQGGNTLETPMATTATTPSVAQLTESTEVKKAASVSVMDLTESPSTDRSSKPDPKNLFPLFAKSKSKPSTIVSPIAEEGEENKREVVTAKNPVKDDNIIDFTDDLPPPPSTPVVHLEDPIDVTGTIPSTMMESKKISESSLEEEQEEEEEEEEEEDDKEDQRHAVGGPRRSARIRSKPQYAWNYEERDDDDGKGEESYEAFCHSKRSRRHSSGDDDDEDEDDDDDEPRAKRGSKSRKQRKASIFMSKEEKARLQAEEREQRIQAQILRTKMENDSMMAAAAAVRNPTVSTNTATLFLKPVPGNSSRGEKTSSSSSSGVSSSIDLTGESGSSESTMTSYLPPACIGYPIELLNQLLDKYDSSPLRFRSTALTHNEVNSENIEPEGSCTFPVRLSYWQPELDMKDLWLRSIRKVTSTTPSQSLLAGQRPSVENSTSSFPMNYNEGQAELMRWLKEWANRRTNASAQSVGGNGRRRDNLQDSEEEEDDDDDDSLAWGYDDENEVDTVSNLFVICGPTGSGKTSLVHEAARIVTGVEVLEVNTSQVRSSSVIRRMISEVAASHRMGGDTCSVVLFDEADIVFEEEDQAFHSALLRIAQSSRCPIILTVETVPSFISQVKHPVQYLFLKRPTLSESLIQFGCTSNIPTKSLSDKSLQELMTWLLCATKRDLRMAKLMLALIPDVDLKTSIEFDLNRWLLRHELDFALWDNMSLLISSKRGDNIEGDTIPASPIPCLYRPEVESVYPRIFRAGSTSPQQAVISGLHFLQRSCRAKVILNGELIIDCRIIGDDEIMFEVPKDLPCGLHFITVRLETEIIDNKNEKHRFLITSLESTAWLLMIDSSNEVDTLSKHFLSLGKSYAQWRLVYNPMSDVQEEKQQTVAQTSAVKKKRPGYASSRACKGRLSFVRKSFKQTKSKRGNYFDSDDVGRTKGDEQEEEDDDDDEEEKDSSDDEVFNSNEEVSVKKRKSRFDSDSESEDRNDNISKADVEDQDKACVEEPPSNEENDREPTIKSTNESSVSHTEEDADALLKIEEQVKEAESRRSKDNTLLPLFPSTLPSDIDMGDINRYSTMSELLSSAAYWGHAFDPVRSESDSIEEVQYAAALSRSAEQYNFFCHTLHQAYFPTATSSLSSSPSSSSSSNARREEEVIDLVEEDYPLSPPFFLSSTQATLCDNIASQEVEDNNRKIVDERELLKDLLPSPFMRFHFLCSDHEEELCRQWMLISGQRSRRITTYATLLDFIPFLVHLARESVEADERLMIQQRESMYASKRRRLSNHREEEDSRPTRYSYLTERLGWEEKDIAVLLQWYGYDELCKTSCGMT